MNKINCIVFGLSGIDTAPIVRMMKTREEFEKVVWFGVVDDVDINSYEAFEFSKDYDHSITLPKGYFLHMKKKLGQFLISSARRNKIEFNERSYALPFGPTYAYLHQFTRYCYLIYDIFLKNNINLIVLDGFPHTSIDILICQAARFFEIKTLFLYQSNIPNKYMYFSELQEESGDFSLYYSDKERPIKETYMDYKVEYPKVPYYMKDFSYLFYTQEKLNRDLSPRVFRVFPKKLWLTPVLFALQLFKRYKKPEKLKSLASILLKHADYNVFENNLKKMSVINPNLSQKYVYFPLSFQPEMTTECMGEEYIDIISAIEKLHSFLPNDWKIYVKEHTVQYEIAREQIFFDRLKSLERVVLVDRSYSSFVLIENSQFVSSINGTAGMEGLHMGKKVLNFGTVYYEGLPGVKVYTDSLSFSAIEQMTFSKTDIEIAMNNLISRMETGIVNDGYSAMLENFDEQANAGLVSDFIVSFYNGSLGV